VEGLHAVSGSAARSDSVVKRFRNLNTARAVAEAAYGSPRPTRLSTRYVRRRIQDTPRHEGQTKT
jgi:hypothetical protein